MANTLSGGGIREPSKVALLSLERRREFHNRIKEQHKYEWARLKGLPLETTVRPAVPEKAYALLDRLLAKRRPPGEEAEASIRWGQPSDFEVEELKPPTQPTVTGVNVGGGSPDDPETPPNEPVLTITYNEVERTTHVKRVTNPEDEEQYVDVEVIDDITFDSPSGVFHKFVLNNPD